MREMGKKGEGAGGSSGYGRPKNLCQYLFGLCRRLFKSRHKLHMSEESCALVVERLGGKKRRNQGRLEGGGGHGRKLMSVLCGRSLLPF